MSNRFNISRDLGRMDQRGPRVYLTGTLLQPFAKKEKNIQAMEYFQVADLMAKLYVPEVGAFAALYDGKHRRAQGLPAGGDEGFASVEAYAQLVADMHPLLPPAGRIGVEDATKVTDDDGGSGGAPPDGLGGMRTLPFEGVVLPAHNPLWREPQLDVTTASAKLRVLVEDGHVDAAQILVARMSLFVLLWRCYSLGVLVERSKKRLGGSITKQASRAEAAAEFVRAQRPSLKAGVAVAFDYEVGTSVPAMLFPDGIVNDALQFHHAVMARDAALYMELGHKLSRKMHSIRSNAMHTGIVTVERCSPLPDLMGKTTKWIMERIVYYNVNKQDPVLGKELLSTDRQDSLQLKFDLLAKGLLISGAHKEAVEDAQRFAARTRPMFQAFDALNNNAFFVDALKATNMFGMQDTLGNVGTFIASATSSTSVDVRRTKVDILNGLIGTTYGYSSERLANIYTLLVPASTEDEHA
jgi:hypothetical protein